MFQIGEVTEIKKMFRPNQKDDSGNNLPLGSIKIRLGSHLRHQGNVRHVWCRPAVFTRRPPLKGEHVLAFLGPIHDKTDGIVKENGYYYIGPINADDDLTLHQLPKTWWRFKDGQSATGGPVKPGKTFPDPTKKVQNIQPFEGDDIFEGRLGNSIRLGSTVLGDTSQYEKQPTWKGSKNGDPITILRATKPSGGGNGYTIEDIKSDDSSLYLTTSQLLTKLNSGFKKNRESQTLPTFKQPQVVGNADRIVMNATKDKILLIGAQQAVLTGKKVLLQSDKYRVDLDELMDFLKKWLKQDTSLAQGTAQYATPSGPTSISTNMAQYLTLSNVDFNKFKLV